MCGILGIVKSDGIKDEHVDIFNKIFEESESRGHDAFGFCTYPKNILFKQEGRVTDFLKKDIVHKRMYKLLKGNTVVLGHTRATTTGSEKKSRNNHPFTFESSAFTLAHNGMIWNHEQFRNQFKTNIETDSIMILKLIQKEYDKSKNIAGAITNMAEKLRGNYACWLLVKKTGSIYFFRHNNPIYLGYSTTKDMYAFASEKEFLSFIEDKIKQKGFKAGLAYADIKEDTIYRLTDSGLTVMGEFKPAEYSYTNQGYDGGYWNMGKQAKQLEDKCTSEVKDRITFEDVLWNNHKLAFGQLAHNFDHFGINFIFKSDWVEIKFTEESYILARDILESEGLTISPKTLSLRVEYKDVIDVILNIGDMLEEEV